MSRQRRRRDNRSTSHHLEILRSGKGLYVAVPVLTLALLLGGIWLFTRSQQTGSVTPADIAAEIIPKAGDATAYGIALSLTNTQHFIDYYSTYTLTPQQERTMLTALRPLKAPCCDDNSMATCCCPCNLAKSVWGLCSYLVAEKGYDVDQVRESALQWLRFIHSDYYIIEELSNRGVNPTTYGLSHENPCYVDKCELPFVDGGCGGMGTLVL